MNIIGSMRIKNEEEFIREAVESSLHICSKLVVFDDHSTDNTLNILRSFGDKVVIHQSSFTTFSESDDRNFLLKETIKENPDWVLCLDGDEAIPEKTANHVLSLIESVNKDDPAFTVILMRVLYFWNDRNTIRTDGVYESFFVPRVWTTWKQTDLDALSLMYYGNRKGFHCGSIPSQNYNRIDFKIVSPIYHYGYIDKQKRLDKYAFYTTQDDNNEIEDNYRHMVIGDLLPDDLVTKHAGPLRLEKYDIN